MDFEELPPRVLRAPGGIALRLCRACPTQRCAWVQVVVVDALGTEQATTDPIRLSVDELRHLGAADWQSKAATDSSEEG